jgi:DNA-binding IclR family transcriptional regulator
VAELVAAYEAGASSAVLAERFGISKSGVNQLLHQLGVAVRTPRSLTSEQVDVGVELYGVGLVPEGDQRAAGLRFRDRSADAA